MAQSIRISRFPFSGAAVVAALAASFGGFVSCGDSTSRPDEEPPCDGAEFWYQSWSGGAGAGALCNDHPSTLTQEEIPELDGYAHQFISFGGGPASCYLPDGFVVAGLWFYNVYAEDGARGELLPSMPRSPENPLQPREIGVGDLPFVQVSLALDLPNELSCGTGLEAESYSVSGEWEVLHGGTWGDIVDVEARNVRFDENGGGLVLDRMYWRVRLQPPPPP